MFSLCKLTHYFFPDKIFPGFFSERHPELRSAQLGNIVYVRGGYFDLTFDCGLVFTQIAHLDAIAGLRDPSPDHAQAPCHAGGLSARS